MLISIRHFMQARVHVVFKSIKKFARGLNFKWIFKQIDLWYDHINMSKQHREKKGWKIKKSLFEQARV